MDFTGNTPSHHNDGDDGFTDGCTPTFPDGSATAHGQAQGWQLDRLRQSTIVWSVLEEQAQRLESVSAEGEVMALRETLLIVGPWGGGDHSPAWAAQAARVEALIAMDAPLSAAIGLLPSGSTYCARSLANEPASGHVTLAGGATGRCEHAATPPLMLTAALFRALATHVARH
jgi:hypothetical protein